MSEDINSGNGKWKERLEKVADHLESLEDMILPFLLARAQYRQNPVAYEKGESGYEGRDSESLLDVRLLEHEEMDARAGRYTSPEEVPFNKGLPGPTRKFKRSNADRISGIVLKDGKSIDLSGEIFSAYLALLKRICLPGDDEQYGSSTDKDISAMRVLSERIHYGAMYIAECKFNTDPEGYKRLIKAGDTEGIKAKLTRQDKEIEIVERVRIKVIDFQKYANPKVRHLIDPEVIAEFYRNCVIPLTKKGEVQYLMQKKV